MGALGVSGVWLQIKDVMAHLYFKMKETSARQQPPDVRILKHLLVGPVCSVGGCVVLSRSLVYQTVSRVARDDRARALERARTISMRRAGAPMTATQTQVASVFVAVAWCALFQGTIVGRDCACRVRIAMTQCSVFTNVRTNPQNIEGAQV